MWKRRNKKEFEMLAVKCLLVLDSFYVTMKDTVVSFDAIVYSKQKIGTKKCLQTFYASTRGPSVSNPVYLWGIRWTTRFRILLSVKVLEIKQMLQLLISCLLGTFFFRVLRRFWISCVPCFFWRWGVFFCPCMKSFVWRASVCMFERLLGSSGIVAGGVVPGKNHALDFK